MAFDPEEYLAQFDTQATLPRKKPDPSSKQEEFVGPEAGGGDNVFDPNEYLSQFDAPALAGPEKPSTGTAQGALPPQNPAGTPGGGVSTNFPDAPDRSGFVGGVEDFAGGLTARGGAALARMGIGVRNFGRRAVDFAEEKVGIVELRRQFKQATGFDIPKLDPTGNYMDTFLTGATGKNRDQHLTDALDYLDENVDLFKQSRQTLEAMESEEGPGFLSRASFVSAAESLVPSVGAMLPGLVGGTMVGSPIKGAAATTFIMFSLSSADEYLSEVEAAGGDPNDAKTFAMGVVAGVAEGGIESLSRVVELYSMRAGGAVLAPVKGWLAKSARLTRGTLNFRQVVKGAGASQASSLSEGITEGTQAETQALIRRLTVDKDGKPLFPDAPKAGESFKEAFNVGYSAGLMFFGAGSGVNYRVNKKARSDFETKVKRNIREQIVADAGDVELDPAQLAQDIDQAYGPALQYQVAHEAGVFTDQHKGLNKLNEKARAVSRQLRAIEEGSPAKEPLQRELDNLERQQDRIEDEAFATVLEEWGIPADKSTIDFYKGIYESSLDAEVRAAGEEQLRTAPLAQEPLQEGQESLQEGPGVEKPLQAPDEAVEAQKAEIRSEKAKRVVPEGMKKQEEARKKAREATRKELKRSLEASRSRTKVVADAGQARADAALRALIKSDPENRGQYVQEVAEDMNQSVFNGNLDIEYFENQNISKEAKALLEGEDPTKVNAFYDPETDKIYVNLGMKNPVGVQRAIWHESTHKGLAHMFRGQTVKFGKNKGKDMLEVTMGQLLKDVRNDAGLSKWLDEEGIAADYESFLQNRAKRGAKKGKSEDQLQAEWNSYLGEELVTHMAEKARNSPTMRQKLVRWIKSVVRQMGINWKVSKSEIDTLIGSSLEKAGRRREVVSALQEAERVASDPDIPSKSPDIRAQLQRLSPVSAINPVQVRILEQTNIERAFLAGYLTERNGGELLREQAEKVVKGDQTIARAGRVMRLHYEDRSLKRVGKKLRADEDQGVIEAAVQFSETMDQKDFDSLSKSEEDAENQFFGVFLPKVFNKIGGQFKAVTRNFKRAAQGLIKDIDDYLKTNPEMMDYYKKDVETTKKILKKKFPDMTDDQFAMFRLLVGVTSSSTKLPRNVEEAVNGLREWMEFGNFDRIKTKTMPSGRLGLGQSTVQLQGMTSAQKAQVMLVLETVVKQQGSALKAIEYLQEPVNRKELNAFNREMGYKGTIPLGPKSPITAVVKAATGQAELVPRMFIFGEKIGAYTMNQTGDSRYTTVDIWEARLVRSLFSGMLTKKKVGLPSGKVVDSDMAETEFFQEFAQVFKEEMEKAHGREFDAAELQAMRWFYMLDVARRAGYTAASTQYTVSHYAQEAINKGDRRLSGEQSVRQGDVKEARDQATHYIRGYSGRVRTKTWTGPGQKDRALYAGRGARVSPEEFSEIASANKASHKFGTSVDVLKPKAYKGYELIVVGEGDQTATISISRTGEVGSVTKSANAPREMVQAAFNVAIASGKVKWLNGFDTRLPGMYAAIGFEARGAIGSSTDPEVMPEGWDFSTYKAYNDGKPDVVFMVFTGVPNVYEGSKGLPRFEDIGEGESKQYAYDLASQAAQDAFIGNQIKPSLKRNPQLDTPEFKKFFEGSKVVDEKGEPLVVYHGTAVSDISEFYGYRGVAGHFAFDSGVANEWAMARHEDEQMRLEDGVEDIGDGGQVYPAYLRAENIFDARKQEHLDLIGSRMPPGSVEFSDLESKINEIKQAGFDSYYDYETTSDTRPTGIAVFESTQIKSATGNRGTFDATNPDIRASLKRPDSGFYSQLERNIEGLKQDVFTPSQLLGMVKKLPGTKQEEIEDLGLEEYLQLTGPKVKKADVLEFIRNNGPEVEIKVLDGPDALSAEEHLGNMTNDELREHIYMEMNGDPDELDLMRLNNPAPNLYREELMYYAEGLARERAEQEGVDFEDSRSDSPKFDQPELQLPGGENYREVLIKVPETRLDEKPAAVKHPKYPKKYALQYPNGDYVQSLEGGASRQRTTDPSKATVWEQKSHTADGIRAHDTRKDHFTGGHFDDLNVLAHLRVNDRIGPNGERILFIEEVQSDWHSEGRKKGYGEQTIYEFLLPPNAFTKEEVTRRWHDILRGKQFKTGKEAVAFAEKNGFNVGEGIHLREKALRGPPDAPFKKSWAMLAMKQALKMAQEGGYDAIAWTPGEVQQDRYDLSKRIDNIEYNKAKGEDGGRLAAFKGGTSVIERQLESDSELEKYVGKEIASRVLKSEQRPLGANQYYFELEGLDLKVGGEWAVNLYDKMLPKELGKHVKKLGTKVETTRIFNPGKVEVLVDTGKLSTKMFGRKVHELSEEEAVEFNKEVRRLKGESASTEVWTVPLPEESRAKIAQGQIRYSLSRDQQDQAYMRAVESGDTATAQRMVDEVAKKAGYTVGAIHSTWTPEVTYNSKGRPAPGKPFFVFKKTKGGLKTPIKDWGFFFSPGDGHSIVQDAYANLAGGNMVGGEPRHINAYMKLDNPMHISTDQFNEFMNWGMGDQKYSSRGAAKKAANSLKAEAIDSGHDGFHIMQGEHIAEIVAFESSQIKLSDAVTKDKQGNVIPLSQRFDQGQEDIRYSLSRQPQPPTNVAKVVANIRANPQLMPAPPFQIKPNDLPDIPGHGKPFMAFIHRNLTKEEGLPKAVFEMDQMREFNILGEIRKAQDRVGDLRRAMKTDYGSITEADMAVVSAALSDRAVLKSLPRTTRRAALAMRRHVDRLSKIMISEGMVDATLAATFTQNLGVYLNRSYAIFDDPKLRKLEKLNAQVVNDAAHYLRNNWTVNGNPPTDDQIKGKLNELLQIGDSPLALVKGGTLGSKDLNILKKKGDIAPEIRALWGEYTSPIAQYSRSVIKMASLIENERFLNSVKLWGRGRMLWDAGDPNAPGDARVPISAEGNKAMEPLAGMTTTKQIAEVFQQAGESSKWVNNVVAEAYFKAHGAIRLGKTVGSVQTHVRNVMSNLGFLVANAHLNPKFIGKAVSSAWGPVFNLKTNKERRDYIVKMVRLGLIGQSANLGEVNESMRDAAKNKDLTTQQFLEMFSEKWWRKSLRKVGEAYQAEDDMFKVFAFENEYARQRKAIPVSEMSDEKLEAHVANIIRDTYPTYANLNRAAKALRRFPLTGTFVSFPAEVIRTTANTARIAYEEMNSDNPAIQKIGVARAAGLVSSFFISGAVAQFVKWAVSKATDEDDDYLRRFVAPWTENSPLVITDIDRRKGKVTYVDSGYTDPHALFIKPAMRIMNGEIIGDEAIMESAWEALKEFTEPFISEDMVVARLREAKQGESKSGKILWNDLVDDDWEKFTKGAAWILEGMAPGTLSSMNRIYRGSTGATDYWGRALNPWVELGAMGLGIRMESRDIGEAFEYQAGQNKQALQEADKQFTRAARSKSSKFTREDLVKAHQKMEEDRRRVFNHMVLDLKAALNFGVTEDELREALKRRLYSDELADMVIKQEYKPYRLTESMAKKIEAVGGEDRKELTLEFVDPKASRRKSKKRSSGY